MLTRVSVSWSLLQEFSQKIVNLATSVVIARILTPSEIGIFSVAMSSKFLIDAFREFGVSAFIVKERNLDQDKIQTVFGVAIVFQTLSAILVVIASSPLSKTFGYSEIQPIMLIVAIAFLISPLGSPASAILQRQMRFDILFLVNAAAVVASSATSIILALQGLGAMALAWGFLVGAVCRSVFALFAKPQHIFLKPSLSNWRAVVSFGGYLTISNFVLTAFEQGRKMSLAGLQSPALLAQYERSEQLGKLATQSVERPINTVFLSRFSANVRNGVPIDSDIYKLLSFYTVLFWPLFGYIAIFSIEIVTTLFGGQWGPAATILPIIMLGMSINISIPKETQILIPHSDVRRVLYLRLCYCTPGLGLCVLAAIYGLHWFAIAFVVSEALRAILTYVLIKKYVRLRFAQILNIYFHSAGITLIALIPAVLLALSGLEQDFRVIILSAVGCFACWTTAIFLSRHAAMYEILRFVQNVRHTVLRRF